MNMYIPILIVVLSNTLYHICAKSTPADVNTFASVTVTYLVGAACSLALYFITSKDANLAAEFRKMNWTTYALGIAIVGLEAGNILMYKVGWNISIGLVVQNAFLAVVLLFVGYLLYKEPVTARKVAGLVICLAGLYLLN